MQRLVPELTARGLIGESSEPLHHGVRLYTGDLPHVRYLKISEGCDHGCAFCAIPLMRGKHRSFALDEVIREAQLLELQGAREINLVAQDLAHYGHDRSDGFKLPELLEALVSETSVPWIRMLYLYSTGISDRLLEVVSREPRVLPYVDMPIQHGWTQFSLACDGRNGSGRSASGWRAFAPPFPMSRCARPASSGFPARP